MAGVKGRAGPEWEYRRLYLPRGVSRCAAQQLLAQHAEYDHWELDRLRLFPDGSRGVLLRRRIIRQGLAGVQEAV